MIRLFQPCRLCARVFATVLVVLVLAAAALSQQVTITGTVTDSTSGLPYQNGSGRATLVSGNGSAQQAWTINQTNPVRTPVVISALDSYGKFTVTLTNTCQIDQQSAVPQWQFSFTSFSFPNGQVSFTVHPLSLCSDTDISAQIAATPPARLPVGGGTVNLSSPPPIGNVTPNTGAFTSLSASTLFSGPITSTGSSSFSGSITSGSITSGPITSGPITSGPITSTGASSFGSATFSGPITSTVSSGTSPFNLSSSTIVPNLNASLLLGNTWGTPAAIGSTTPNAATFTNLTILGTCTGCGGGGGGPISGTGSLFQLAAFSSASSILGIANPGPGYHCLFGDNAGYPTWEARDGTPCVTPNNSYTYNFGKKQEFSSDNNFAAIGFRSSTITTAPAVLTSGDVYYISPTHQNCSVSNAGWAGHLALGFWDGGKTQCFSSVSDFGYDDGAPTPTVLARMPRAVLPVVVPVVSEIAYSIAIDSYVGNTNQLGVFAIFPPVADGTANNLDCVQFSVQPNGNVSLQPFSDLLRPHIPCFDPLSPGPIGTTLPDTATFSTLLVTNQAAPSNPAFEIIRSTNTTQIASLTIQGDSNALYFNSQTANKTSSYFATSYFASNQYTFSMYFQAPGWPGAHTSLAQYSEASRVMFISGDNGLSFLQLNFNGAGYTAFGFKGAAGEKGVVHFYGGDSTTDVELDAPPVGSGAAVQTISSGSGIIPVSGGAPLANGIVCWKPEITGTNRDLGYCSTAPTGTPPTCTCTQ